MAYQAAGSKTTVSVCVSDVYVRSTLWNLWILLSANGLPWEWHGKTCVIFTRILAAIISTSLPLKAALLSECMIFAMPKIINTFLYRDSATVSANRSFTGSATTNVLVFSKAISAWLYPSGVYTSLPRESKDHFTPVRYGIIAECVGGSQVCWALLTNAQTCSFADDMLCQSASVTKSSCFSLLVVCIYQLFPQFSE